MSEQQKPLERRFAACYRKTVDLGGNKQCSLKRHFSQALREVVGYLDLLASKNPEMRFVYCSVHSIVEHCNRFESEQNYKKRGVEYALEYLRRRHIISERCVRYCDGQLRDGFIVAPHEHLTIKTSATKCRFVGMAAPFDCWEQFPSGAVFWADPSLRVHAKQRMRNENCADGSAVHCADGSAVESAVHCADSSADTPSAQQCGCESLQKSDDNGGKG